MAWSVELAESADRRLGKLDPQHRKRILKSLDERIAGLDEPRSHGEALHGSALGEFWKYRVGDCRLICKIEDGRRAAPAFAWDTARQSTARAALQKKVTHGSQQIPAFSWAKDLIPGEMLRPPRRTQHDSSREAMHLFR